MPLGPQIVTYGNIQSSWILTVTLTPVAVAGTTAVEQSFPIPGLQLSDNLTLGFNGLWNVLIGIPNVRVVSAGVLGITFINSTGGSLTPPSGVYNIEVNRPLAGMVMPGIQ
jgi:hypothetical protein